MSLHESMLFKPFCMKIGWGLAPVSVGEKLSKLQRLYISHIPAEAATDPTVTKFDLWAYFAFRGHNQLCQILFESVWGFDFVDRRNVAFAIEMRRRH